MCTRVAAVVYMCGRLVPMLDLLSPSYVQGYAKDVSRPSELPMIDLVLAVRDSEAWHKANLERSEIGAIADSRLAVEV